MNIKCEEIKKRMNQAEKERSAFLFAVDFEMRNGFFVTEPLSQNEVWFDIKGVSNISPIGKSASPLSHLPLQEIPLIETLSRNDLPQTPPAPIFEAYPEDYPTYRRRFRGVMEGLKRGDSYLTNLTIKTPLRSRLTIEEIFHYSRATYKLSLPGKWVCFSPECFIRIAGGVISTFPMKGTIDARLPEARKIILNDPKETAEHNTIVDLLRNDLSRVSDSVKVNRFRYIDELRTDRGTLLQVSSEIEGRLTEEYAGRLGDLIFELLPAGSVSGAPKGATLRLIREAEQEPRGFYTGVAGYFDGQVLESFVLIRFIEQCGSRLFFRSGGGITANSIGRKEYEEAIQKVYLPF